MYPILGEPFGFKIRSFGVMVALAFVVALWVASRHARRTKQVDPEAIGDLLMWVMVGGILGARVLYCIVHWKDQFAHQPLEVLKIWKGGLVYYGGFLGAFVAGWFFTKKRKIDFVTLGDICMPAVFLGQAVGRIGCFLVGDDYGKPAPDLPWAVTFPDIPESLLPQALRGIPLHPTQLYMLLQAFVIFLILAFVARRQSFRGQVFYLALILYPIGRSICEVFRGDNVERGIYHGLSTSQWISIPLFLVGIVGFTIAARRREPLRPASAPDPGPA
ncbi:MAG: prolipoprotein diacylglyceryl transferase [Planctomycetota bacterium JB042]